MIGTNPFPNYIAALALKPEKITLIHSDETKQIASRLEDVLKKNLKDKFRNFSRIVLADATNPYKIFEDLESHESLFLKENSHLHYTGGTKAMAAQCLRFFYQKCNKSLSDASYLDDKNSLIRFDDGTTKNLEVLQLKIQLADLLQIHGLKFVKNRTPATAKELKEKKVAYLDELAHCLFKNPELAGILYERSKINKENKIDILDFSDIDEFKGTKIPQKIDLTCHTTKEREKLQKFWNGVWLEHWVSNLIFDNFKDEFDEIYQSVECVSVYEENSYKTEIDLCLIKGHQFYAISLTTDGTNGLCKSKLFEITIRGRQLGGDHAKTALGCFLDGMHDKKQSKLKTVYLEECMKSNFASDFSPPAFGLSQLKKWAGLDSEGNPTREPDLSALEEFLGIGE
jgi:hypothetical protein